ncbi:MAG: GTPase Era [bacterium]|nr:GTPase Era [bacterium]
MSDETSRSGFVTLAGWTNVGKSTLLNRLVGTKLAAVADVAQTTRCRITGVRTFPGRGQIVFVDTPGIHRPRHRMNRAMVEASREAMRGVDLVILVVDASRGLGEGDAEALRMLNGAGATVWMALNKVDQVRPKHKLLPMMERAATEWGIPDLFPISALTGEGCDALLDALLGALPVAPALYPDEYLTDQPERVLVAEWIREKLLAETRQELPHATAVVVEHWNERDNGVLAIDATILVDRESQRPIVIGKGGELLKRVGTAARAEIEPFLDRRVHLSLWVKIRRDWRDDRGTLRELGLT